MKTLKNVGCLAMLLFISLYSYGQDQSAASSTTTPAATAAPAAKEEDEEPAFVLSGSIDTYFHTSFGGENPFMGTYAPSTSFADLKGFSLGMVNLIGSYSGEKVGFVADVVFGPRGQAAVFGTASGQAIINQMFAYYKLSDAVTLNLGQFNTFVGYEVISPAVNFHYSTSYLFSWGPFNHTGLRADFSFGEGGVAKLAIMNPTDIVEFNPVNTYTLGAQVGKTGDFGGVWVNFLYGDQDGTLDEDTNLPFDASAGKLFQGDITLSYNVSETFSIGLNTSYQQVAAGEFMDAGGDIQDVDDDASSFFGVALYPKLTVSETFSIGLRAEYFSTKNDHFAWLDSGALFGLDDNDDGSVMEFTLSGNYKVGGLTFIPEIRIDKTSEDSFFNSDGDAKDMLATLNMAAVYKF
jgi:hypothetical protein